jgi:FMN phosphatase YigB (HAD superfamily)
MSITMETNEAGRGTVPVELPLRVDASAASPDSAAPPAGTDVSSPEAPQAPPEGEDQPVSPEAPDEDETDDEESDEPSAPKKDSRAWRRRRNTVLERNALREENAQLRAQMAALQVASVRPTPSQPPQQPSPAQPTTAQPRYDDFHGDNEAYWTALADWRATQRVQAILQERDAHQAAQMRQEADRRVNERILDGQTAHDDFDTALQTLPRYLPSDLFPVLEAVVIQEEQGSDLLYYLGKHPAALQELARYRPGPGALQYLQELLKRLGAASNGQGRHAPAPGTPALPAAPLAPATVPPVRPLSGNGQVSPTGESPADVAARGGTVAEYEAAKARWAERR